ncbi:MAG TPA: flagellar basal body protein FliL [Methylophaga sp.]|nr:MAG: flagellar basal body protein FliL [Gammaproteobacteria bacterium]HHA18889.1 flagellar basal body protein FliL [Methylophaga sp.]
MVRSIIKLLILVLVSFTFFSSPSWAEDDESSSLPAIYYQFPEPIRVNFLRQSQEQVRLFQIKVVLMSYDQEFIDSAILNLPMLQDALRTLLTEQTIESVNSVEGRQTLQVTSLETIKALLKEETGKDDLEAVYFTSFILQ